MASFAENKSAIQKNQFGLFTQPNTDNVILMQKGLMGETDENIARNFNWSAERYKVELENLVYRHIKCKFTDKSTLCMQLRIDENKLNEMMKNAELRELNIKQVPQDVNLLKAQVAAMQFRMQKLEEMVAANNNFNRFAQPAGISTMPSAPPVNTSSVPFNSSVPTTPPNPFQSHITSPNTFNQLYGNPMSPNTFTQKNYHDISGEWSH